jgi:hypothetical protein
MSFATSIPMAPGNVVTLSNPISSLILSVLAAGAVTGCFWDLGISN